MCDSSPTSGGTIGWMPSMFAPLLRGEHTGARRFGKSRRFHLRIVAEVGAQPAFGLLDVDAAAPGEVLDLVLADARDAEVLRLRVGDVIARHRSGRQHGEALGERHAGVLAGVEQTEQLRLLAV